MISPKNEAITPFRQMMREFVEKVCDKAEMRARQKGRPMDPWNYYTPEFIRERLMQEINEWREKANSHSRWEEQDELYDIAALAGSAWRAIEGDEFKRQLLENRPWAPSWPKVEESEK